LRSDEQRYPGRGNGDDCSAKERERERDLGRGNGDDQEAIAESGRTKREIVLQGREEIAMDMARCNRACGHAGDDTQYLSYFYWCLDRFFYSRWIGLIHKRKISWFTRHPNNIF
jgi:hypothetical protein